MKINNGIEDDNYLCQKSPLETLSLFLQKKSKSLLLSRPFENLIYRSKVSCANLINDKSNYNRLLNSLSTYMLSWVGDQLLSH